MNILNISSIIPLKGLKRENDIVLRVQDHLKKTYNYDFTIAKSLPFTPKILGVFSKKWKKYNKYLQKTYISIDDYKSIIYPWIMPPTSNLWANYILLPFNILMFKLFTLKKIIPVAQKSDLLLAQNNIPDAVVAYLLSKKSKKPYVLNIRGKFNKNILFLPFLSKIYKNSENIITHSPQNYLNLKKIININLILHPVDDIFFKTKIIRKENPIELISVCRLLKLKHLDWVIDALAQIKKMEYNFKYHIVGDGPELDNLKMKCIDNNLSDNVLFHGYKKREEVVMLLQRSHIFIMPSYPETLGRSFLEAAASGCLIIGHENTGVFGLLKHKESAIFVNKDSINNELKQIFNKFSLQYINSYYTQSSKIIKNLTWENIGNVYKQLYTNTINKQ